MVAIMTEPRLELAIGAPVETTDGPLGRVHQVILNPAEHRVVGLVVRTGWLPRRDLIVPVDLISDTNDERIMLRVNRDELLKQPGFDPSQFLPLGPQEQGYKENEALASIHGGTGGTDERALVASHQRQDANVAQQGTVKGQTVALRNGQQVWATDGRAGRVDLLLLDPTGEVRHFVIRKGRLLSRDVIVPMDWISKIDERGVWLAMDGAALERLPPYRPDSAIAADVDDALWADEQVRELDMETIDVAVSDGVVFLVGYAMTPTTRARAEQAAKRVPGVLRVENRLVTDDEVVAAVGETLARDPRTRGQHISFHSVHGIVTLSGETDGPAMRDTIEEIVASVPQVRGVVNLIQAPGVVVDSEKQRVVQPRIGQDVHANDMFLGRVEKVIISPRNRRMTALVVHGNFPDPKRIDPDTLPGDEPRVERRVVIPIHVVKTVTIAGVWLSINGIDAAKYSDLNPNEFNAPDENWQPPYPYSHADVLLDRARVATARERPGVSDSTRPRSHA